jgi:hypothetical protein
MAARRQLLPSNHRFECFRIASEKLVRRSRLSLTGENDLSTGAHGSATSPWILRPPTYRASVVTATAPLGHRAFPNVLQEPSVPNRRRRVNSMPVSSPAPFPMGGIGTSAVTPTLPLGIVLTMTGKTTGAIGPGSDAWTHSLVASFRAPPVKTLNGRETPFALTLNVARPVPTRAALQARRAAGTLTFSKRAL